MKRYIEKSFGNSILSLAEMIENGEIRKKSVENAIREIEKKFPGEFANTKETIKKKRPWDRKTLNEFGNYLSFCPHDKNAILYMAEVADEVYKPKRRKKFITIAAVIAVIIAVIAIIIKLRK